MFSFKRNFRVLVIKLSAAVLPKWSCTPNIWDIRFNIARLILTLLTHILVVQGHLESTIGSIDASCMAIRPTTMVRLYKFKAGLVW
jgi:hypothetical protein